ncbi:hypothetical protein JCM6882_007951 [Rhodosporidiobolus microsporus]
MPVLEFPPPPPPSSQAARTPLSPSRSPNTQLPLSTLSPSPASQKRAPPLKRDSIGSQVAQLQLNGEGGAGRGEGGGDGEAQGEEDGEEGEEDVSMDLATSQSQSQTLSFSQAATGGVKENGRRVEENGAGEGNGEGEGEDATVRTASRSRSRSRSGSDASRRSEDLVPLHVEVRLKPTSTMRYDLVRQLLHQHLDSEYETLLTHSEVHDWRDVGVLAMNVERVWIGECALPTSAVPLDSVSLHLHIYQPPSSSRLTSFTTSPHAENDEDGDSDVPAASVLELPSLSLEGVWDSLIYEGEVKEKLLSYIYSTMLFSDAAVDFNIVTWNRVVLLHGPPGTGKTSLCRALAQKLAIRLSDRYQSGKLIEINSHSLFSKWFSESGKLVQRLFGQVTEMVDDEGCFVVVLIDEVESLTAARAGAMSGKEPSDALRVVNALLTQLDKLKHRKNCLVMTTSNLSGAIDNAFIDRADIKQYIGLPPAAAVYWILQSCLNELMRACLIPSVVLQPYASVEVVRSSGGTEQLTLDGSQADKDELRSWKCSEALADLARQCQGLSGRTLRRLPVLAHARHLSSSSFASSGLRPRLEKWLDAMKRCVEEEGREMEKVEGGEGV